MPDNDKKEMLFIFYFLVSKKKKTREMNREYK